MIIKCPICLDEVPESKVHTLACHPTHRFCRTCLHSAIKTQSKSLKFPPNCPLCRKDFTDADVQSNVSGRVFEMWDYLRNFNDVRKEDDFFACRHCRNGVLVEKGDSRIWKCDRCQLQYCLKCKREGHTGDCDEYEMYLRRKHLGRLSVKDLFQKGKLKRCPACQIYTHRKTESMNMSCERCGTSWCWRCIRLKGHCKCTAVQGMQTMVPPPPQPPLRVLFLPPLMLPRGPIPPPPPPNQQSGIVPPSPPPVSSPPLGSLGIAKKIVWKKVPVGEKRKREPTVNMRARKRRKM